MGRRRRAVATAVALVPALAGGLVAVLAADAADPTSTPLDRRLSKVYVTGYTWFDNTPRGSAQISHPVFHRTAGGTGTYANPVTVAVGHTRTGTREILDLPAGTRLYLPYLRRYGIVEDTCGDGLRPQDVACHNLRGAPKGASLWIDLYVGGGRSDAEKAVNACAGHITDGDGSALRTVIVNPRPGYPVLAGLPFSGGRCTTLFR